MTTTLQDKIDATVASGEMVWKVLGKDEAGKVHFIKFGTPGTYSRTNVRAIAQRLFEKTNLGVSLVAIRRDDVRRCPWVPAAKFYGQKRVSNSWEASK